MSYVTRKRVTKVVGAIATTVAAVLMTGCDTSPEPVCNTDGQMGIASCDGGSPTPATLSSSAKPTTSASRTTSIAPTTTATTSRQPTAVAVVPTPVTAAAPDTTTRIAVNDGYIIIHSDGQPPTKYQYAQPTTTSPAPALAPTQQPAPVQTIDRRAFIPQDNAGLVTDTAGTPVYADPASSYNPPSGYGNPRLVSNGTNGFSELTFSAAPTVLWSYIVVQNESQPDYSGARFNLSSANIDIGAGQQKLIAYDFSGFDSIKAIYFVS